jgi:hypothetical protein
VRRLVRRQPGALRILGHIVREGVTTSLLTRRLARRSLAASASSLAARPAVIFGLGPPRSTRVQLLLALALTGDLGAQPRIFGPAVRRVAVAVYYLVRREPGKALLPGPLFVLSLVLTPRADVRISECVHLQIPTCEST